MAGGTGACDSFVAVSLFAPVFGSVIPEFTGGLLAPLAAAGPE